MVNQNIQPCAKVHGIELLRLADCPERTFIWACEGWLMFVSVVTQNNNLE